ncbi:hypothetical protein CAter282_1856 [Collimonas arenae]|uniref:Uncharacterized protein n=1 Tax=Collimonas arenae TaxID=279058 RepID=A0A127PPJ9_9BURK|nr:hypothetical protein CAter10_2002 [Collimonas arenae]AMP09629.1 hypothetical protein CAter282_1856 [Collimonas arenae]
MEEGIHERPGLRLQGHCMYCMLNADHHYSLLRTTDTTALRL